MKSEHYGVLLYDAAGRRIRRNGRYAAMTRKIADVERTRMLTFPDVAAAKVVHIVSR